MIDFLTAPDGLILLAPGAQGVGYLIIHQMSLRITMLAGSSLSLAQDTHAAKEPLWGAIWGSGAMVVANLIGIGARLARNARWRIPEDLRALCGRFDHLAPGDFLRIVQRSRRFTLERVP